MSEGEIIVTIRWGQAVNVIAALVLDSNSFDMNKTSVDDAEILEHAATHIRKHYQYLGKKTE